MCLIDSADLCDWVNIDHHWRRAVKIHQCDECCRMILPGEDYHRHLAKADGRMQVNKHCAHCDVAAQWLSRECHGYLFQGVEEDIAEHFDFAANDYFLPWMWLGRMTSGMRTRWEGKNGQLRPIPVLAEAMQGPKERSM